MKSDDSMERWFDASRTLLEDAYVAGQQPWQQSGFGLHSNRSYENWEAVRRPVADCLDQSGTFLDVGCANGYLLECVMRWVGERGIVLTPYGLDISDKLIALAKKHLPAYSHNLFVGNAFYWEPPRRFDYVRTELVYVPDELHAKFIKRITHQYLEPGGRLLVAEYRGRNNPEAALSIDQYVAQLGFSVTAVTRGFWDGLEQTRVAVIQTSGD